MQILIIKTVVETLHCITVKFRIKVFDLFNIKIILFYLLLVCYNNNRNNINDIQQIVERLITFNGDVNIRNYYGETALQYGILAW
jgi:hypothetical protein